MYAESCSSINNIIGSVSLALRFSLSTMDDFSLNIGKIISVVEKSLFYFYGFCRLYLSYQPPLLIF